MLEESVHHCASTQAIWITRNTGVNAKCCAFCRTMGPQPCGALINSIKSKHWKLTETHAIWLATLCLQHMCALLALLSYSLTMALSLQLPCENDAGNNSWLQHPNRCAPDQKSEQPRTGWPSCGFAAGCACFDQWESLHSRNITVPLACDGAKIASKWCQNSAEYRNSVIVQPSLSLCNPLFPSNCPGWKMANPVRKTWNTAEVGGQNGPAIAIANEDSFLC